MPVHIASSVQKVFLSCQGGLTNHIPHIMKYENKDVLLTVRGRPPFCLKCRTPGHIRSTCKTPYCKSCKVFGHEVKGCKAAHSYASRLRGGPSVVVATSVNHEDPQEAPSQASLGGDSQPQVDPPQTNSQESVMSENPQSLGGVETSESNLSTPPPKRKRKHKVSSRDSTLNRSRGMEGIETAPGNSPYPGSDLEQFDWVDPGLNEDPPDSVKTIHTPGTQSVEDST